jgi:hypothetical protein
MAVRGTRSKHPFNPVQIKDGWIVRLYKDGRIKSKVAPYEVKHKKKEVSK